MGITPAQITAAEAVQHAAAHSSKPQVRLLAGPGTGKSASIEERARWLVAVAGIDPKAIGAVSFTRAAAADLQRRIRRFGVKTSVPGLSSVHVSTLHSVALRILKKAGLLTHYPVEPRVLDAWELEHILDAEFGVSAGVSKKSRREEIRRQHEAYWNTGSWSPPNYSPATPPITKAETDKFQAFLTGRGQLYACVLPGEIVKKCVDQATSGVISLSGLFGVSHLIVDEYQDLNPVDIEFVDQLAADGIQLFVAGDDDQSIYSFRHAAPVGIQDFHAKYPGTDQHTLSDCFRCTSEVLAAGYALIAGFPDPKRLPKSVVSLYAGATPTVKGVVHRWKFADSVREASAIAESCRDLIAAGVEPEEIMILLSSVPALGKTIAAALKAAGVPFDEPRPAPFSDTDEGRFGLALLRTIGDVDDLVALRTLLGLRKGVGTGTCHVIAQTIIVQNLSLSNVLRAPLPAGVFSGRSLKAITATRDLLARIAEWTDDDTLEIRRTDLENEVIGALGAAATGWATETAALPDNMLLKELRAYVASPGLKEREAVLRDVTARVTGVDPPDAPAAAGTRVRIMTMHGVKGLSSKVVFIPALEDGFLPGPKRAGFPGLVNECARLVFVSITRARAACIISLADQRYMQGTEKTQVPSRFAAHLGGKLMPRSSGLTAGEVSAITGAIRDL